jgi:hypothetical protein
MPTKLTRAEGLAPAILVTGASSGMGGQRADAGAAAA